MRVPSSNSRGQSEAAGVVLLLGIVILSLGALGVLGANSFDETEAGVSIEIAQHELTRLAGEIEDVTLGDTPVKTVPLKLDGADSMGTTIVRGTAGSISVTVDDEEIYSGDLGVIEYEHSGVRIAYQGGGVWRRSPGGYSEVVLAPSFTAENLSTATLSIPITVVGGMDGLSDGAVIERVDAQKLYPSLKVSEKETVQISIQSRYYRAWGKYVVERLNVSEGDLVTDPNENQVTVTYGAGREVFLHVTVYRVEVSGR